MSIFSRFTDIISSNISSMLDCAEDPEKMIRLMLREMEETLVELKANCAANMAESATLSRQLSNAKDALSLWENRAELALKANREDMAREAILESEDIREAIEHLEKEQNAFEELINKCREDIDILEERITSTRDKQKLLASRHQQASLRLSAREKVRKIDNLDSMKRFEELNMRIDRIESEADLVLTKTPSHGTTFRELEKEECVSQKLAELKAKLANKNELDN